MPSAAAFFDLDKTLIEGSSAIHFARASYHRGLVSRRQLARDLWANLKFRLRGSTDEESDLLRQRVLDAIAGHRVVDLARLAPEVLAGVLPRTYPEMLRVAWEHQDAGRDVYIVTAASQEMASSLAQVLAFDGGIGTRSEIRDGYYTGRPAGPFTYREGKALAIREVAERQGYDLTECFAYSDSESDLPMLRAVGHPVAVNPDAGLLRIARDEGWQVMTFDKLRRRVRIAAAACSSVASASSQLAGRNSRQSSGHEVASVTAQMLTPIWQLPTLPSVPEYCRATPGEAVPSLTKPVSSTTQASGAITATARRASRWRTGSTAQVDDVTNCCSPCSSTPSRSAIGCID